MKPRAGKRAPEPIQLSTRIALRETEAAAALGICERSFRSLLPEIPHYRRGNLVLISVRALEKWIEAKSAQMGDRVQKTVQEILDEVG